MTEPNPQGQFPSSIDRPIPPWLKAVALLAFLLLSIILYAPRLKDFFLSDDFGLLWACWRPGGLFLNNGWISFDSVPVASFFRFMPCSSLSGWLIYSLSGLNPLGWHVASLLLHLGNSLLVGVLVRRVIRSDWAGAAAAALFVVHYVHAEPVIWISGRMALLVTFFILGAIVAETRPRKSVWGWGRWIGLFLGILAFLSKEDSIVLPMLLTLMPLAPMTVPESLRVPPHWLRDELSELRSRVSNVWPYWALGGIYLVTRLGAIALATQEQVYRLELNFNVIKNVLFVFVANLFPADFRTTLETWNRWYKAGEQSALPEFLVSHPGIIVASVVAAIFWMAVLLWGNRAARRMTVLMIVAALPVLFFRGTGERLLYLSSVGSAGTIAVMLAGWHISFREILGRAGRFIAPCIAIFLILLHASWLREKQANWETAAGLSRAIVDASVDIGPDLPPGAAVQLIGLPDNVEGAWVFRSSVESAFRIYAQRPDVTVIREPSDLPDSVRGRLLRYRWDGAGFVPSE